jgi:hypothetical protein
MEAFWADAESIFETARAGYEGDSPDCDWAFVIGQQGHIHILEASGWALGALTSQYGTGTVYHLTRQRGNVRVEGRRGAERCLLETESPSRAARQLLAPACAGLAVSSPPIPAALPATIRSLDRLPLALPSPLLEEPWTIFA